MLAQGLTIAAMGDNVMVKLPGSEEGYEVLEELTARGISTNNTTSFAVAQYIRCSAAVSAGLNAPRRRGGPFPLASVITHMSAAWGNTAIGKHRPRRAGSNWRSPIFAMARKPCSSAPTGRASPRATRPRCCNVRCGWKRTARPDRSRHMQDFAGWDMVYTCPPRYIPG